MLRKNFGLFTSPEHATSESAHDTSNYYQRPDEVKTVIKEEFSKLLEQENGYVFTGQTEHVIRTNDVTIYDDHLIKDKIEKKEANTPPVTILDIGSGDFSYLDAKEEKFHDQVEVFGIAVDQKLMPLKLKEKARDNPHYTFQNAEFLSSHYPHTQFDFIFSQMTFRHFIDPVGSLIEAYKILKPNGILIVDQFAIPGCENYLLEIIDDLRLRGFKILIAETDSHPQIVNFMIQKTEQTPDLTMPVNFLWARGDKVYYKPSERLEKIYETARDERLILNELYNQGSTLIADELTANNLMPLVTAHESLASLFSDQDFGKLNADKQYFVILGLTAKLVRDYQEMPENFSPRSNAAYLLKSLDDAIGQGAIFPLTCHPFFSKLDTQEQHKLLLVAAMKEIVMHAKHVALAETLTAEKIVFKKVPHRNDYTQFGSRPFDFLLKTPQNNPLAPRNKI